MGVLILRVSGHYRSMQDADVSGTHASKTAQYSMQFKLNFNDVG